MPIKIGNTTLMKKKDSVGKSIAKGTKEGAIGGAAINTIAGGLINNSASRGLRGKAKLVAIGANAARNAVQGAVRGGVIGGTVGGVNQAIKNKKNTKKIFNQNDKLTNFLTNSANKNSEFILGMKKPGLMQKIKNTGTRLKAAGSLIGTGIKKVAGGAIQGVENAVSGIGNAVKSTTNNVPGLAKKKKMFSSSDKLITFFKSSVN